MGRGGPARRSTTPRRASMEVQARPLWDHPGGSGQPGGQGERSGGIRGNLARVGNSNTHNKRPTPFRGASKEDWVTSIPAPSNSRPQGPGVLSRVDHSQGPGRGPADQGAVHGRVRCVRAVNVVGGPMRHSGERRHAATQQRG